MSNGLMKICQDSIIRGEVRTMRLNFSFRLQPITDRRSEKAPHYDIIARSPYGGHDCNVGKAWERVIQRGQSEGQSMFSLVLDDPEFGENPVNISAFPAKDGYELQVERKRGGNQVSPTEATEQAAAA